MRQLFPFLNHRLPAFLLLLSVPFLFTCCSKHSGEAPPPPSPIHTPKGTTLGSPVSATIGSGGGGLISADGRISLIVPAGAVTSNTTFSIQPIRNTLDTNSAAPAYRLLPEGQTFAQPVRVSFH